MSVCCTCLISHPYCSTQQSESVWGGASGRIQVILSNLASVLRDRVAITEQRQMFRIDSVDFEHTPVSALRGQVCVFILCGVVVVVCVYVCP